MRTGRRFRGVVSCQVGVESRDHVADVVSAEQGLKIIDYIAHDEPEVGGHRAVDGHYPPRGVVELQVRVGES